MPNFRYDKCNKGALLSGVKSYVFASEPGESSLVFFYSPYVYDAVAKPQVRTHLRDVAYGVRRLYMARMSKAR